MRSPAEGSRGGGARRGLNFNILLQVAGAGKADRQGSDAAVPVTYSRGEGEGGREGDSLKGCLSRGAASEWRSFFAKLGLFACLPALSVAFGCGGTCQLCE